MVEGGFSGMMNPKEHPCYGCDKRHIGCHGDCKEYKERKAEEINEKKAITKERNKDKYATDYRRNSYYGSVAYKTRLSRRHR
jgi:hypothetical protein